MSDSVISIQNVSKRYNITQSAGRKYVALRDVITNILWSPFAHAKSKAKQLLGREKKEEFWALQDINLEVKKGEVIGIIGKNGAGKSTLLKILTGITPPTTGEIKLKGKAASLLEVGTGFHPELTGRENIFLNGAILGMTRKEIKEKMDRIIEFSGVEQFIDTPVKRYSSGMYVRLAFSVAAHMEPDILLVDEVLAVGDAEFQKKCLGKMDEVTKKEGRTIIFVSHNMSAINQLCKRSVLLDKGKVVMMGDTDKVIQHYLAEHVRTEEHEWRGMGGNDHMRLTHTQIRMLDSGSQFHTAAPLEVTMEGEINQPTKNVVIGFTLYSEYGNVIANTLYDDAEQSASPMVPPGTFKKKFIIPENTLAEGSYRIEIDMGVAGGKRLVGGETGQLTFTLINISGPGTRFGPAPYQRNCFRPLWSVSDN